LAAAIKERFGLVPQLKEGHGGIFEVSIDDEVVCSNGGVCGRIPSSEEVLQKIGQRREHYHAAPADKPGQSGMKAGNTVPGQAAEAAPGEEPS